MCAILSMLIERSINVKRKPHAEEAKKNMSIAAKKAGTGKWMKGRRSPNWKGGRITLEGYWYLYEPKHPHSNARGYIAEHRLIVEKAIGRYLKPKEVCHHINKSKKDNRLENIMVFSTHSAHMRYEQAGELLKGEQVWPIN